MGWQGDTERDVQGCNGRHVSGLIRTAVRDGNTVARKQRASVLPFYRVTFVARNCKQQRRASVLERV